MRICVPLLLLALTGCATLGHTAGSEEFFIRGEGRLPLALVFPEGLSDTEDSAVEALAAKNHKEPIDLWRLARYHHVVSARPGRFEKALECYRGLLGTMRSNGAFAENNIACIYAETGRFADSERALKALTGAGTGIIAAHYNLYVIYRSAGRERDSLLALHRMRDAFPASVFVNNELGNAFYEHEDYVQADLYFARSLSMAGDNHIALYGMARTKERLGSFDEAESYYRRCIGKHPYFHEAYVDYSAMLIKLNREDDARRVLLKEMKRMKKAEDR